jgi:tetraacyldisaccharide 4'-kinase
MRRARLILLPLSLLYWLGVAVRNWFFDIGVLKSKKIAVPVISIGNISAGGVGKTPFVELVIERSAISGQLSVVSRGYGRKSTGTIVVSTGHGSFASVEESGDEPIQLALKYPQLIVVADEQRVRGAEKAVVLGAETVLLDDGFQHRYLHRDLNIVILTTEEILHGDLVLPAGNKREPCTSLKRADVIAVTRCTDLKEYEHVCAVGRENHSLPTNVPTVGLTTKLKTFKRASSNEIIYAESLRHKNVIAFSGIGNPKSFEDLMMKSDIKVLKYFSFSDHHWYKDADIKTIMDARKQSNAEFILTTEKDAVRLKEQFAQFLQMEPVIIAEIRLEFISGEQTFNEFIHRLNEIIKD